MEINPNTGARPARGRTPVSRRWLLGASAGAFLAVGCKNESQGSQADSAKKTEAEDAPQNRAAVVGPSGVLGANFNEDPTRVDRDALNALDATWVRGFVPMDTIKDGTDPSRQRAIQNLLELREQGFGTILALKFQFSKEDQTVPSPTGEEMKAELAAVDEVLRTVLDKVDILTVGNEPFLETHAEERLTKLNPFYQEVAKHVIAYRKKRFPDGCRTHLYMGALNHLDDPEMISDATRDWIEFVNDTPQLEGLDIHPHVTSAQAAQKYLDYVLRWLDDDKKFLVTEFSLVNHYEKQMTRNIPADFVDAYEKDLDITRETKVWQLLKLAAEQRFTQQQWNDFLRMSPWFESGKHFMRDEVRKYRETGRLAVATYGVVQQKAMVTGIDKDKKPWMLNSLYVPLTVQHDEGGELPHNYTVFDDFTSLQREQDRLPVHPTKARV
ncbi:hypothetical protein [Streptomyces rapamycinicus]|uniref:Uncharacterized protein n=2 Tax=Streptomyces rapamycinicus TaxID=1226757 RepID=A0A0A0NSW4_STRRN|nr:hypothetical protein [Streptomyces rapamycinicus]AGP59463.1 hypothetical protein M271_40415 [Streptomyces rapamycinicus NRRL 5491]MBB4787218.1 hypothetical protein [Streptomyces rapamycinicus]RLV77345.1 hypothetical protein D3C57_103210 [Streptomyces rapamycinicus NRRL 5491]UTO67176.1 hypothetical protein LJB45_36030 [Streptomyces rapamycinicus]UTP35134.1 hypothetical protein LIV37_41180 [Streptomyces rapamycinicus NRRL 5491]